MITDQTIEGRAHLRQLAWLLARQVEDHNAWHPGDVILRLGGRVHVVEDLEPLGLFTISGGEPEVSVRASLGEDERFLVLAHELAHLVAARAGLFANASDGGGSEEFFAARFCEEWGRLAGLNVAAIMAQISAIEAADAARVAAVKVTTAETASAVAPKSRTRRTKRAA